MLTASARQIQALFSSLFSSCLVSFHSQVELSCESISIFDLNLRSFKCLSCKKIEFLFTYRHILDQKNFQQEIMLIGPIRLIQKFKYIIFFIIFRNMITCPWGYLTMDLKLDYESLNDLKDFQGKMEPLEKSWYL